MSTRTLPTWDAWHHPDPTPRPVRPNPASRVETTLAALLRTQQQSGTVIDLLTRGRTAAGQ